MKILKTILLSLFMAASVGTFTTSALAEEGRVKFAPAEAIDNTKVEIQKGIDALITGDVETAKTQIKVSLNKSKEINANDKLDAKRSKANQKLKDAAKDIADSNNQGAEDKLRKAIDMFENLKQLI